TRRATHSPERTVFLLSVPVRRTFHGMHGARPAGGGHFVVETGAPGYEFLDDPRRPMVGSAIPSLELAEDTVKHTFSAAFVLPPALPRPVEHRPRLAAPRLGP